MGSSIKQILKDIQSVEVPSGNRTHSSVCKATGARPVVVRFWASGVF